MTIVKPWLVNMLANWLSLLNSASYAILLAEIQPMKSFLPPKQLRL